MSPRSPSALLVLLLAQPTGCASPAEEASRLDWGAVQARFVPAAEPAEITSATGLEDYVALALARNPRLQRQAHLWRAGLERIPQARSLPDPQLTYGRFVEEVETRVGPQRHRVGASQRVPWPGKLLYASDVALEEARGAQARTEEVRRRVVFEVTRAYARYYELAREVEVTAQVLALMRHHERVAQTRMQAGAPGGHRDVIKAQVELGRLEDLLASLEDARRPRAEALRALLDLPQGQELPWPTRLPQPNLERDAAQLVAALERRSPRLAALDRAVDARTRGVDLARQGYLPDFVFGVDYVEVGPARASGVPGSGDDALSAMVGISLPIWFGKTGAAVSEARARLRAARHERQAAGRAEEQALSEAHYAYRDADRKLHFYEGSLLPKAEESLAATAQAFEAGIGSFLDVLDAERSLLDLQLSLERARADRITAHAQIELHVGPASPEEEAQ